jgi:hypothetical protein
MNEPCDEMKRFLTAEEAVGKTITGIDKGDWHCVVHLGPDEALVIGNNTDWYDGATLLRIAEDVGDIDMDATDMLKVRPPPESMTAIEMDRAIGELRAREAN